MPKCRMIEFQKLISPILQDNADEGRNQGGPDAQSKTAWQTTQTNQGKRVSWVAKHKMAFDTLEALQWSGIVINVL